MTSMIVRLPRLLRLLLVAPSVAGLGLGLYAGLERPEGWVAICVGAFVLSIYGFLLVRMNLVLTAESVRIRNRFRTFRFEPPVDASLRSGVFGQEVVICKGDKRVVAGATLRLRWGRMSPSPEIFEVLETMSRWSVEPSRDKFQTED